MRAYNLTDGNRIDLNQVISVSDLHVNKNDSTFNSYEVALTNGYTHGILESSLPRAAFLVAWEAV